MPKGEHNTSEKARMAANARWARERGESVPLTKKGSPEGRVRSKYGNAKDYNCAFCYGRQARDWAWLHGTDREEVTSYVPLCKPCHNSYDRASRIAGIRRNSWKISNAMSKPWSAKRRAMYDAKHGKQAVTIPKLKLTKSEFNPDELDVEYDDSSYDTYTGEIPKTGTILLFRCTKAWWTYAADETPMMKILSTAEQGENGTEEYDGLTVWDNLPFKPSAAFKYGPWLDVNGLTLQDVFKNTFVADDDDNVGAPIEKIGDWEPDSDTALYQIVIKRDRFDGEWSAKAKQYLPLDDDELDEEDEADEDEEPDEDNDDDEEEEEDDEEEEDEPEPPTRGKRSRAAAAPSPAKPATRTRTAAARGSKAPAAKPAAPASGRVSRTAAKAPAAKAPATRRGTAAKPATASSAPAKAGRKGRAAQSDDPPF